MRGRMSVRIDSGPVEATSLCRVYEQAKWPELMQQRKYFIKRVITYDCWMLSRFVKEAEEMHVVCGFATPEEMIRNGYELEPEEMRIAAAWLGLNDRLLKEEAVKKYALTPEAQPGSKGKHQREVATLKQAIKLGFPI